MLSNIPVVSRYRFSQEKKEILVKLLILSLAAILCKHFE